MNLQPGSFVELDGLPAIVVQTPDGVNIPEDHVALWFGEPGATRISDGGSGNVHPELWIVPTEVCRDGLQPKCNH